MADYTLQAQARTITGKKVKNVRKAGFVPGTIYGPKHQPLNVQFIYRDLEVALMEAGGTNIIDIVVDGQPIPSVARDVQRHIIKRDILHVDFFAVDMDADIRADIPIVYNGQSPIVEARQGILLTGPNALTIETRPDKLMNEIHIDLAKLTEIGATISVADLDLGPGVTVLNDPEEMIARVVQTSAARAALVDQLDADGEEEAQVAEPEVISRGKEEEDFE